MVLCRPPEIGNLRDPQKIISFYVFTKSVYWQRLCRNAISGIFRMRGPFGGLGRRYKKLIPGVYTWMCVETDRDYGQQHVSLGL